MLLCLFLGQSAHLSTEGATRRAVLLQPLHAGAMMTRAHAIALDEARSCLAALADTATTLDASVAYEHALLYLTPSTATTDRESTIRPRPTAGDFFAGPRRRSRLSPCTASMNSASSYYW